ncbi:hypothetical protein [Streptacidiphilus neutrinimicus]|uniref:hypothetical protein n=1 Tax=Streptacidiphilus neutrinimicus TaxID=105420 RepID=UPI001269FFBF|nr:hypothetical protein [Streptacidiphilus neutrinimicus]
MGSRAQYVVVENGAWQRFGSHWGANRIAADLLAGPAAATRCFRALDETETWLDDLWCEGAALVDHDRRVLLWYAFQDSWADHRAVRAVLARTWPGWDVRFAHDGMGDLTHHLGLGRELTREPGWLEHHEPSWFTDEDSEPWAVVSLRFPDGSVRAFGGGCRETVEHVLDGPGLIDLLLRAAPTPQLTDMPYGGVHFEPAARTVSVWAVQTVAGLNGWPLPGWEGWTLDFHGDDHAHHAAVLPSDYPFPQSPLAPALRALRDRLGTPPPDTGVLLARAAAAPAPESATAVVTPAALVPHDPAAPTPAELAALRAALDVLIAEAEAAS